MGDTTVARLNDPVTLPRALDDPEWLGWPRHYNRGGNRGETAVLCGGLVTRLEGDFAVRCTAEQDTQDSSEYGRVVVPAACSAYVRQHG